MIDTGCSRFLIGQNTLDKWEQVLTRRWDLNTQRIQLAKTTFRFDNDETLETRTLAMLLVGIAGVNGVLHVYVVPGGAPLLLSEEFLRDLCCHIDLGRGDLCSLLHQNPVASTEHGCRKLHLSAVSHIENAEEEVRCVVSGLPKLYNAYGNHHDDSSGDTESRRQGRNHGNRQVHTAVIGVRRGGATFQPEDGGTHQNGSIATRGQLRHEVAEKGPFGGTIRPEQSDRNSIPTETGDQKCTWSRNCWR